MKQHYLRMLNDIRLLNRLILEPKLRSDHHRQTVAGVVSAVTPLPRHDPGLCITRPHSSDNHTDSSNLDQTSAEISPINMDGFAVMARRQLSLAAN